MASEGVNDSGGSGTASRTAGDLVLSDVAVVRLGGAAEVVAVGLVVVSLAVSVVAGLPQPTPDPAAMGAWLSAVAAGGSGYALTTWLFVLDHVLEIAFVVALYHLLRDGGGAMRFAAVAGALGLLVVALSGMLQAGLAALAGEYAAAGGASRPAVVAAAVGLERVRLAMNVVGTVLAWGVGGALFSVGILRTGRLSRWVGWGGLVFAGVVWLNALRLASRAFEPLVVVMLLVGLVWLPAIGVSLLRVDADRIPAAG